MKRDIIEIDESLCNGCGQCVTGCAEGALAIVDGKARLISDKYCDGLGACLGECPTGALTIAQREAAPFDEEAVEELLASGRKEAAAPEPGLGCGCPSTQAQRLSPCQSADQHRPLGEKGRSQGSTLGHWPVKLRLAPPTADYLKGADILLTADCAPVSIPGFNPDYTKGKIVLTACPKFGDNQAQATKLAEIMATAKPASVTVLRMEVPCCAGLGQVAGAAADHSDKTSGHRPDVEVVTVARTGQALSRERLDAPCPCMG